MYFYLLRMEKFLVGPLPDLIHDTGLQVHEDGPGHVLARPGLVEECGEAVVSGAGGVSGHGAIGLEPWALNKDDQNHFLNILN